MISGHLQLSDIYELIALTVLSIYLIAFLKL